jgi:hypothetical protein
MVLVRYWNDTGFKIELSPVITAMEKVGLKGSLKMWILLQDRNFWFEVSKMSWVEQLSIVARVFGWIELSNKQLTAGVVA